MSYNIILDPLARIDIIESIDWYNNVQANLGDRFYSEVQESIRHLSVNPNSFAVRYKDTRMIPVNKFPFMVHYTTDENNKVIVVLAVLHTSRNPKIWGDRG